MRTIITRQLLRKLAANILSQKNLWIVLILVGTLSIYVMACSEENLQPYDPFRLHTSYAELTGYTKGFMPGNTYDFGLSIRNNTYETWQNEYCLFLVDEEKIVLQIESDNFNLQSAGGLERTVQMNIPEDFEEGAYGLALAIPDTAVYITTIRIGKKTPQVVGPFLDVNSCLD